MPIAGLQRLAALLRWLLAPLLCWLRRPYGRMCCPLTQLRWGLPLLLLFLRLLLLLLLLPLGGKQGSASCLLQGLVLLLMPAAALGCCTLRCSSLTAARACYARSWLVT